MELSTNNYKGKPKGSTNNKNLKWKITIFDKDTNTYREGKFTTISALNESMNLKLNADYVKRIMTHYRADEKMRNGENSFLARWGHIKIEKIFEKISNEIEEKKPVGRPDTKLTENIKEYTKEYNKQYRQSEKGIKINKIAQWKYIGIKYEDFDELYTRYICSTNCEDCGIDFSNIKRSNGYKCLDYDQETGLVRNIVCMSCNKGRN